MNYSQPYIFFSPVNTPTPVTTKRKMELNAEVIDLLNNSDTNFHSIVIQSNENRMPGVMLTYSEENLRIVKSLAADFDAISFYSTSVSRGFTVHNIFTNENIDYDSYIVSKTKPIDNFIEINETCYLTF